jgi:hypothetical protein
MFLFVELQLEKFVEWRGISLLLAAGESIETNTVVRRFAEVVLEVVRAGSLKLYPLGGQHYAGANTLARARFPHHRDFRSFSAVVFFPMPIWMAQEVGILLILICLHSCGVGVAASLCMSRMFGLDLIIL